MGFINAIGLIGIGYILRDYQKHHVTYYGVYDESFKRYFKAVAMDKLDTIIYGSPQKDRFRRAYNRNCQYENN